MSVIEPCNSCPGTARRVGDPSNPGAGMSRHRPFAHIDTEDARGSPRARLEYWWRRVDLEFFRLHATIRCPSAAWAARWRPQAPRSGAAGRKKG